MIGFVYADCLDPNIHNGFHRYVCNAFQSLSLKYHSDILVLTDPSVTLSNLSLLLVKCDFVFYWGHGRSGTEKAPMILGSTEQDLIPLYSLIGMMQNKVAYFDACEIGIHLKDQELGSCTIACPVESIDYDTSVKVGCAIILGLLGSGMTFARAFQQALELTSKKDQYLLLSDRSEFKINVPVDVRLGLIDCFAGILQTWLQRKNN